MGTRNSFFEIDRQFGHAPSKRFASPGLQRDDERVNAVFITPTFAYTRYYAISATSVRIWSWITGHMFFWF